MEVELLHRPGNAAAKLKLAPSESCYVESGNMIAMTGNLSVKTTTHKRSKGNIFRAMKRLLSGESFFVNHFTAGESGGEAWVAPTLPGDMTVLEVTSRPLIVQGGSFVAADSDVEIDLSWQGFKSLFSGEWIFWLKTFGTGKVVINSFGCIYAVEVDGETIVDSGHIVAFDENLKFKISKAGSSWVSSFLGGEGLVCRFQGKGTVWCQSHSASGFGRLLGSLLRPRKR